MRSLIILFICALGVGTSAAFDLLPIKLPGLLPKPDSVIDTITGVVQKLLCFLIDSSNLVSSKTIGFDIIRKGLRKHFDGFAEKLTKGLTNANPLQVKLFNRITELSHSDKFNDQWAVIYKSIILGGTNMESLKDICIWANIINQSAYAINGLATKDDEMCAYEQHVYVIHDAGLKYIAKTLLSKNCDIDTLPKSEMPECYDASVCHDEGRNFLIDDIWSNYKKHTLLKNERFDDVSYNLAKELYASPNLSDKFLSAVTTMVAHETYLSQITNLESSQVFFEALKGIGLANEGLVNIGEGCNCADIQKQLVERLQKFVSYGKIVIKEIWEVEK